MHKVGIQGEKVNASSPMTKKNFSKHSDEHLTSSIIQSEKK